MGDGANSKFGHWFGVTFTSPANYSCARITKEEKKAKLEQVILAEKEKQMIERERHKIAQDRRTVEKAKQKTAQEREDSRRTVISEQRTNDLNTEDSRRNTVRYLQSSGFTFEQILEYLRMSKNTHYR